MFDSFFDTVVRRIFFPRRDHSLSRQSDHILRRDVHNFENADMKTRPELELETRAWIRDFWSRSFASWVALLISCIALTISICTFYSTHHLNPCAPKSQNDASNQPNGKIPQQAPN